MGVPISGLSRTVALVKDALRVLQLELKLVKKVNFLVFNAIHIMEVGHVAFRTSYDRSFELTNRVLLFWRCAHLCECVVRLIVLSFYFCIVSLTVGRLL